MTKDQADISTETGRRPGKRRRRLLPFALFVGVIYALGFGLFLTVLPAPVNGTAQTADGIVALTGEGDRLGPAVTLLEQGSGKRLLITGVNPLTNKRELKTLLHGGDNFECCADLGFAAADTRGNAEETAQWARDHRYSSLIVVTANYHMPRSLEEFGAAMPGVKLIPYPVAIETANAPVWQSLKRLNGEYAKYLASLVRNSVRDLMRKSAA